MPKIQKSKTKNDNKISLTSSVFLKTQIMMIVLNLIFLLVGSLIVYSTPINKNIYFYIGAFLFSLTSFIGGYFSGYKIHKNGILTGLVFCLPTNIIFVFVSLFTNKFKFDMTCLITCALVLIASMLGGVLSVNTRIKSGTKRKGRKQ